MTGQLKSIAPPPPPEPVFEVTLQLTRKEYEDLTHICTMNVSIPGLFIDSGRFKLLLDNLTGVLRVPVK